MQNPEDSAFGAYERVEKIGEGTYGIVFKGRNRNTGQCIALKKIWLNQDDDGVPATALREIAMLKELRHENVVECAFYRNCS